MSINFFEVNAILISAQEKPQEHGRSCTFPNSSLDIKHTNKQHCSNHPINAFTTKCRFSAATKGDSMKSNPLNYNNKIKRNSKNYKAWEVVLFKCMVHFKLWFIKIKLGMEGNGTTDRAKVRSLRSLSESSKKRETTSTTKSGLFSS